MPDHVLTYDPNSIQDSHGFYALLREEGPVHQAVLPLGTRAWIVTRYPDARAALNDPRLSKDAVRSSTLMSNQGVSQGTSPQTTSEHDMFRHMLNSDAPDHTRLRKLVTKAFTARRIEALRPRVQEISDALIANMVDNAANGTLDLLDNFAFRLPITVICELLGVPEEAHDDFRRWSNTLISAGPRDEAQVAALATAKYLTELIETKRAEPGDDLLSALVRASDDDDSLTTGEVLAMAFLLMVAGHETTVNLIGNGTLALLRNPEQLAALRADRALLPSAIEEFLRFDGPLNLATFRFTTEQIELGGVTIPKDEFVMISLLAANRDPHQYEEPDRLDLSRDPSHVAFGHGIHFCLGAPLARMEAEIAFAGLLDHFESIELAVPVEDLAYRHSSLMHGLTHLPVLLRPRTAAIV
ncbi:MAG TPA: cytochrome P450 [Pseudonocardiaceae bacterium]|nr:cytochrome P450 [Pseudonocardiaceae bacterium]